MRTMEYKHLSVNLKKIKKIKQNLKRTRRQNRKIDRSNHSITSKWFFQITKTCTCIVKTVKSIQVTRFQKN